MLSAKAFKLAGKGQTNVRTQQKPKSFMQELDEWSEINVIEPLSNPQLDWDVAVEQVKKAIRAKVLESYRNGQQAGPRRVGRGV